MIVKLLVGPSQVTVPFSKWGVTTIVAMTGAFPVLTAVNEMIIPEPVVANPMPGVSFIQE